MKGREFLEKMELVSPVYVEAADRVPQVRARRWPKLVAAAACLCLVAWGAYSLSGGWGRGPGSTIVPDASRPPEVSGQPESSGEPSPQPSRTPVVDDSEAMAAYRDVLSGKAGFTYVLGPDETLGVGISNIKSIYNPELPDDYKLSIDFTVLDLDGDGGNEVVLWVDGNSAVGCSIVLHYQDGTVYGFLFYPRSFGDLKTDGTFCFSSGAADHGFGRLTFARPGYYTVDRITYCKPEGDGWENILHVVDHQTATADEFDAAISEFYDKEAPAWYELTEENIAAAFDGGELHHSTAPEPCPATLGFENCVMTWEETPQGMLWRFYAQEDGQYWLIAETWDPGDEPEVYRMDLDGDGVDELICNAALADGWREVVAYRNRDGQIERSSLYVNDWLHAWDEEGLLVIYGAWNHTSYFDPERGFVMEIVLGDKNGEDVHRTETFQGLEHFEFEPYDYATIPLGAATVKCGQEPQYKGIENVVFEVEYPPFDRYYLTTSEVNKLIGYLSAMDLSEYETTPFIPEGDGIICTITTADKSYEIIFSEPYVIYDGIVYELNTGDKLFAIVSRIAESH